MNKLGNSILKMTEWLLILREFFLFAEMNSVYEAISNTDVIKNLMNNLRLKITNKTKISYIAC